MPYNSNMTKVKKCTKCLIEQNLTKEFRKDKTKKDGYYSSCNNCYRKKTGATKRPPEQGKWHVEKTTGYIRKGDSRQHRVIMEKYLGRKLEPKEHVHHKNHIKTDNRLENLEVILDSQHHRIHTGKTLKGKNFYCVVCNKAKYYPPATFKIISNNYRCYKCYTSTHQKRHNINW